MWRRIGAKLGERRKSGGDSQGEPLKRQGARRDGRYLNVPCVTPPVVAQSVTSVVELKQTAGRIRANKL